ncbi:MAG TPA: DUF1801 domain-containing protein [Candidatus Dormibacteraeota bacterium]|nr:DUF1801 domain-containing protein [Candidatus Dormibacteraeota bacterium]
MSTLSGRLQDIHEATRPIVEAAIATIRDVAPDAEEIAYDMAPPRSKSMVWKLARYASGGENVVGVGTLTAHAMIFFYRGRELDDGSGLLHGGGKDMRFVRLDSAQDARRPALKRLIKKAFQLSRGRSVRSA